MTFDLKAQRLNRGYTIRGLARELGIKETAIRRLERGHGIRPDTAKVIADHFDVAVTDLLPIDRFEAAA